MRPGRTSSGCSAHTWGQAGSNDVVLFQYSGHGARWKSASQFKDFYPDGKDEGLVCIDSREPGRYDLADKELAVLLAEVARNDPHIAVLLDCCHSGSGTRGANDFTQARPRVTHERGDERPLETYIDGYYTARAASGESLEIPVSRLPTDPDKVVELALYPESDRGTLAGHAETTQIGAQQSELRLLDLEADPETRFQAEVTSLPVPPLEVALEGEAKGIRVIQERPHTSNDQSPGFEFNTSGGPSIPYVLTAKNKRFLITERRDRTSGALIWGAGPIGRLVANGA